MLSNPMSPEMVRVLHERQIHEAAVRRSRLLLAHSGQERPALRQAIEAALVHLGRAIASEPIPPVPDVRLRPVRPAR